MAARLSTVRVPAHLRWTVAGVAGYLGVYLSWQLLRWGGSSNRELIGDLFFQPLNGAAVVAALRAAHRCDGQRRLRLGWLLIALGLIAYQLGDAVQTLYEVVLGEKPYPSIADGFYLSFYPLMVAGVLRLTSWQGFTRQQRLRLVLDVATVALGGTAFVWFLVLGPSAFAPGQSALETLIAIAYPVGDLILITAVAAVLLHGTRGSGRQPLYLLAAMMVFFVAADMVYSYILLHGTYHGGDQVDALWMVALAFTVPAAVAQRRPGAQTAAVGGPARNVSWLPYVSVLLAFATLAWAGRHEHFVPVGGLIVAAVLIALVVAARQLSVQHELLDIHAQLSRAHDELAALATMDSLTGLSNHRGLVSAMDNELARSERDGRACAVLFIDIDHFKALNDSYGHGAGDGTLKEFGELLKQTVRGIDVVGRWGGEEFIVVLPDSDAAEAQRTAERIRTAVGRHRFAAAEELHLTCSLGVAVYPHDGLDRTAIVVAADAAMYTAKRLGRNQVISAPDPVVKELRQESGGQSRERQMLVGAVDALAAMVDLRDQYTGRHGADVAELSRLIAGRLRCDPAQLRVIEMAARLHDIGKVAMPDAILSKPGRLSPEEWKVMQTHAEVGAEVLERIPGLRAVSPIVRAHHERWDGSGYPAGLSGEQIPLGARIVSVADSFLAMTSDRPYQVARSHDSALGEVRRCAGTQFDPELAAVLEQIVTQSLLAA